MTADTTYNGWTNYETWGVALVLNNDEGTQRMMRERAAEMKAAAPEHRNVPDVWTAEQAAQFELEEYLKDFTEDLCELALKDDAGSLMARQVIQAGLADVNWAEIAANVLEGLE